MVMNLQKQLQEKDDALRDISEKLSHKSEECETLMEERDIMRTRNSFDLQQVHWNMALDNRESFFDICIDRAKFMTHNTQNYMISIYPGKRD